MGIPQDIQLLINDILTSYETRIKEVNSLREDTFRLVEEVKKERNKLYDNLKEALAKGKSFRRKDFDNMIFDIRREEEEKIEEVRDLVDIFQKEEGLKRARIVELLDRPDFINTKIVNSIKNHQENKELEITKVLEDFREEKNRINESFKKFLAKGASLRIEDFKKMVKEIRARQQERKNRNTEWMKKIIEERQKLEDGVRIMLSGLRQEQEKMRQEWQNMVVAMKEKIGTTVDKGGADG